MLLSTRLKIAVTVWVAAEILVFAAVVHVVGLGWALLAGVASTILGAWLLKRVGRAAMTRLRATLRGRQDGRPADALDGTLSAVAAAALILPGFLSDLAGLALAIPAVRGLAIGWARRGHLGPRFQEGLRRSGPQTIDLDRDEWSRARPPGEGGGLLR